ncbi:hypothetical protein [Bacillus smithii]
MAELAHDSKAFSLVKGRSDFCAGIEKGSKIKASTEMLKSFFGFNTTKITRNHMPCMRICVFEDDLKHKNNEKNFRSNEEMKRSKKTI